MGTIQEVEKTAAELEANRINAIPFPNRSMEAEYEKLQGEREALAMAMEDELTKRGYDGLVTQSSPHAPECYVQVVCWTPQQLSGEGRLRRSVKIVMDCHPNLKFKRSFVVTQKSGASERTVTNIRELDPSIITQLVLFCLGEGARLRRRSFSRFALRSSGVIDRVLLPLNRPANLDRIFLAWLRQHWLPIALISLFLSFFLLILVIPVVVLGLAIWLRIRYPDIYEAAPVYPTKDPRALLRYDSWHIVVPEIGRHADELRQSIIGDLEDGKHNEAHIGIEQVWNEGLDAMICRNQVVLSFRRCLVFIEIHAYGDDLYLDWEAFLNLGYWAEGKSYAGFPADSDVPVLIHDIVSGVKAIEEFDFSDGNFSVEWVHATVKRHLKRLLAEHEIDQEIDFRVIRENRSSMLEAGQSRAEKSVRPQLKIFNRS